MDTTNACTAALIVSALLLAASAAGAIVTHRRQAGKRMTDERRTFAITPFRLFTAGFFLAAAAMLFPVYYCEFFAGESGFLRALKSVLLSVHHTLRLFVLDGEFDFVQNFAALSDGAAGTAYTVYGAIMYVAAPVLTAGVVISFFKEAGAFLRYALAGSSDIYVLSQLNERSLALARDILTPGYEGRRRIVVFTDVYEKADDEKRAELLARAKRAGAICMKKDVCELGLKRHRRDIMRKIYLIGDDGDDNISHALALIEKCRRTPALEERTEIYVFSDSVESVALLDSAEFGNIKVRLISENRNLMLSTLRSSRNIFADFIDLPSGKRGINAVVVGLGGYGTEMVKALCWCGQLPGYEVTVHVFDKEPDAAGRLESTAPELVGYNDRRLAGEPYYKIVFHDGVDVTKSDFLGELAKLGDVTSAFVTLGDDEMNIVTAMKMRMQFGRCNIERNARIPNIFAVVYSGIKTRTVRRSGLKSVTGAGYGITFIGDIDSRYSLDSIEQNKLEEEALACHMHWVENASEEQKEESRRAFRKYEYYRRSSMAEAIYFDYRDELCTGAHSPEELMEHEHMRWSAYMRAEGYVGMAKKDDIAKTHPSLIPYQRLSPKEKEKDAFGARESRKTQ